MLERLILLEQATDKRIIILDGMKFGWFESEVLHFKRLWWAYSARSKNTIQILHQIALDMDEEVDNVFLLALHLAKENPRREKGGVSLQL